MPNHVLAALAATLVLAVLLVWWSMRGVRRDAPELFEDPAWEVVAEDDALRVRAPNGDFRELRWADVGAVLIRTSDAASGGVSWEFESASGGPKLMVPVGALGIDRLPAAVSRRLPEFDSAVVDSAMESADVAVLEAWRRP